ncbi:MULTISPECIES: TIGR03086 family metal-binding protein [Streptomycetaceae]|uniref:Mycothiol-dependent maleylpyruvate isomerase metal-binding domain-containing protein n=1 Tax=Streptantibioticus cattleyicolor (strain ATCC 35852 / DSM 46488 / JCM 4925 / NBRC 14057 / NRRL 8057) TaxID=1003195 RepID=F8JVY7_STREN|nr:MULTISPECIES: TIGR03086 family metal-binding protein [Streptomycetaceae]AEW92674.1 hypothetical protein SCATT_03030 [Streptantibioticus cattleyicolor NRRL 8057 = DSM 46488]MYS57444.1 TIGR03086 family protein [Streptomyces sp. SID5468]CCB73031.1 conserved protein of unknown function [Streptantibioticus cattleyicolor NRRL 8057 = DSM 46488]
MSDPTTSGTPVTGTDDPVRLLARALDRMAAVLDGVRPDQLGLPTPCLTWDVGTLADHVVHDLAPFTAVARGERPDWTAPVPATGPDRAPVFRTGAARLLAAWRAAGDLTGTVRLPVVGTVPARFPVDQQITEFTVHAWDLRRATDGTAPLDDEVAEAALRWARTALRDEFRGREVEGKAFGPEQPAPPGASASDRLAAFTGRRVG